MKKILLILFTVISLCSCSNKVEKREKTTFNGSGVWISYYELENMLNSSNGFKAEFERVIENCRELEIENLYVHTRAFGETLYHSKYFPILKSSEKYDFDVLEYIIEACNNRGLKVYAWINPYRISSNRDIEKLNINSPAYIWKDSNNIGFANGIYLNPASEDVRRLVLNEIREVITQYRVYGIHFDDYFYPTQADSFDTDNYSEYKNSSKDYLSLEDWRRENVNMLISSCYGLIKYTDKNIFFSISPAASLDNNFNMLYADVEKWIKNGWVDEIIPQVYFGFEYPDKNFRFEKLVNEWKDIAATNQNVKLKIGLASYKAKPTLEPDREEWENNYDIIARQISFCSKESAISGYVYFSYSSLFGSEAPFKIQRENIKVYLKQGD